MVEKLGLFDSFKLIQKREIKNIPIGSTFPLIRWCSGIPLNVKLCRQLNRDFIYVKPEILLGVLALGNFKGFTKYPKADKFDTKKFDLVVSYLQKHYKMSKRDINVNKVTIARCLDSNNWLNNFANIFGLNNKERKALGLQGIKFDKKKMESSKVQSLF